MAKKVLVACGGTGAHVTLAYLRFHILGYALGYFTRKDGSALLPSLFLIDQDDGDAEGKATAWQAARELFRRHPAKFGWKSSKNKIGPVTEPKSVTPLPVGASGDWCHRPNDHLDTRYEGSEVARLFFSERQRSVDYSLGMMGAPALGSLLFALKKDDKDHENEPYDKEYSHLQTACGKNSRIVVTGSGVGGTGASIAPTFALQCSSRGAEVMAVMIQRWFHFDTDVTNQEFRLKARKRNELMEQNEVTGLAQYGQQLVEKLPTVIARVKDGHTDPRQFTADNQQPKSETHLHAVAAISCFRQFIDGPLENGLYLVAAEDPLQLTSGLSVPGGTLGDLVRRAWVLDRILRSTVRILEAQYRNKHWKFVPELYSIVKDANGSPKEVAAALKKLAGTFSEQLEWVMNLADISSEQMCEDLGEGVTDRYLRIRNWQARMRKKKERLKGLTGSEPRHAAQALFEWAAKWVRDDPPVDSGGQDSTSDAARGNFYWSQEDGQGLSPPSTKPGELAHMPVEKAKPFLDPHIKRRADHLRQNGWPDPFAAIRHFEYLIEQRGLPAVRKLEMMILGLISGDLVLEPTSDEDDRQTPSLTGMLKQFRRQECKGVAEYRIVARNGGLIIGFNSPLTLLCPCPDSSDAEWGKLWQQLTDSDDPENWKREKVEWGRRASRLRGLVQRWLNLLRRRHQTESPSWVKVLRDDSIAMRPVWPGSKLQVFWGREEAVTVSLPQGDTRAGVNAVDLYWAELQEDANSKVEESDLDKMVPDFFGGLKTDDVNYSVGQMIVPDVIGPPTRFIWHEHLSQLQEDGEIIYWRQDSEKNELLLELPSQKFARLENFREIRKEDIRIQTCVPLEQCHIPGEEGSAEDVKYPDLPLKAEYIGLLETDSGINVLEEYVFEGKRIPPQVYKGQSNRRGTRKWTLRLRGRSDTVDVSVDAKQEGVGAHWMIWPRFRSGGKENPWSAYYLYQHATDESLTVEAIVLEGTRVATRKRPNRHLGEVHAINYNRTRRSHEGGAPIALVARRKGKEVGIYFTSLELVSSSSTGWKMAVDFGTSHSVAAVKRHGDQTPVVIDLLPELGAGRRRSATLLSQHISQNWVNGGVRNWDVWMPTYWVQESDGRAGMDDRQGLLPTELFSKVPLSDFDSAALLNWVPGEDFAIPVMRIRRPDLAEHILSGFKWDVDQKKFLAHTKLLRQLYLAMMLEIVVAEMVMSGGEIPSKIEMTFTYPLRTSHSQYAAFKDLLANEVLPQAGYSFGTELTMLSGEGLLNESEAAKGGTNQFAEIVLVGDLGGGTLDLFISAKNGSDVEFRKLANSVQIGGSLFLQHLANNPDAFLPRNGGWSRRPEDCLSQLHAWMRSQGAANLFGPQAHGTVDDKLKLSGFEFPEHGNAVRQAVEWYFGLIVEYMARNLVGFVIREWDVKSVGEDGASRDDFPELSVKVQLRGNGWKLWYGSAEYSHIEALVKDWLCWSAGNVLWSYRSDQAGMPGEKSWRLPRGKNMRPKHDPTVNAVGKVLPHNQAHANGFTLPLSDLDMLVARRRDSLSWLAELPMQYRKAEMEFIKVKPSMIIGMPQGEQFEVDELDDQTTREINEKIKNSVTKSGGEIDAPVAALIWEGCFNSRMKSADWGKLL